MWARRPLLLLVHALLACGATSTVTPVANTPTVVPKVDACRDGIVALFRPAALVPEITLVSKPGAERKAAPYDAWLHALGTAVRYRWIVLDDEPSRVLAKSAGVLDADVSVITDYGLDLDVVMLDKATRENGLAWIARTAQKASGKPGSVKACETAMLPDTDVGARTPEKLGGGRTPLLSRDGLTRATTLRIEEPDRSVTLVREGTSWKVSSMAGSPMADQNNVTSALENLAEVMIGETIADDAHADGLVGLAHGAATHIVVTAGTEPLVDLVMGRIGARGTAVRLGTAPAVRVAHLLMDFHFRREPRFWRNRSIWEVQDSTLQRIEIERDHHAVVFRRDHEAWRATIDGRPLAPLSQDSVGRLVSAFRNLTADDFADAGAATGLGKDAPVIRFVFANDSKTLHLGSAHPGGGYFAQVDNDPTVYVISGYPASWVDAKPEHFR